MKTTPDHDGTATRDDEPGEAASEQARRELAALMERRGARPRVSSAARKDISPPLQPTRIRSVKQVGARWRVIVLFGRSRHPLWFTSEGAADAAVDALKAAGAVYFQGRRGFAGMAEADQARLAAAGGRAVQQAGAAHCFTAEEARAGGRAGGASVLERQGLEYFRELGRRGARSYVEGRASARPESSCGKKR